MKKIDEIVRKEILEQSIKERDFAGMYCMELLPKSVKKLTKLGIETEKEQQLRSLHTIYDDRHFLIFFIKGVEKEIITFFEVYPEQSKYCRMSFTKDIWRGYLET